MSDLMYRSPSLPAGSVPLPWPLFEPARSGLRRWINRRACLSLTSRKACLDLGRAALFERVFGDGAMVNECSRDHPLSESATLPCFALGQLGAGCSGCWPYPYVSINEADVTELVRAWLPVAHPMSRQPRKLREAAIAL